MPNPVPFTICGGSPLVIHVVAEDGREYELRLATSVFAVLDAGPEPGGSGRRFSLRMNWALDISDAPQRAVLSAPTQADSGGTCSTCGQVGPYPMFVQPGTALCGACKRPIGERGPALG